MCTVPALVRPYRRSDERGWLLCRLLSFFDTSYYDDVHTIRTTFDLPSVQLVADLDGELVGLLDIEVDGPAATIDSIAVHPDHQRSGIASRLLAAALAELPSSVLTLDAWTREDPSALNWYRRQGFREHYQYLHVYNTSDNPSSEFTAPSPLAVIHAFCHARLEHETVLRSRFDRVYVCTQFLRKVSR